MRFCNRALRIVNRKSFVSLSHEKDNERRRKKRHKYIGMKVLLLGNGGREHALAAKIAQSKMLSGLFTAPGNPGTAKYGQNVALSLDDFEAIEEFVAENGIDLIVVGPEAPLVAGVADYFAGKTPVVGPTKAGAMLEGSKDFAKEFMQRYGIPAARYKTIAQGELQSGCEFIDTLAAPYVLKADGLAAGKGVVILDDSGEAKRELGAMLDGKFGAAGNRVVIEEYLQGIEVSVFVLTDGKSYKILPEAKDYKRVFDGDSGLNTGGMGAVSPVPFATPEFMDKVRRRIVEPTITGLQDEGIDYRGFIFLGLMNCDGDPYVIEYNARLGDPETEVVMPRLDADLLDLFEGVVHGDLDARHCGILPDTAVTVVAVSGGYPGDYVKGVEIEGVETVVDNTVYHAGTALSGDRLLTAGGRVLTVTALADSLESAVASAYRSMEAIKFEGCHYRRDIGQDLLKKKTEQTLIDVATGDYRYGFTTDVATETLPKGLNEETVRMISEKKGEPNWLLEFRLKAYRLWIQMEMPCWAKLNIPTIDYQDIIYYAAPEQQAADGEIDPELKSTFDRLGIPLEEQRALAGLSPKVAVDAVMDSVSVKTTFRETLAEKGIIFCSFSEAVRQHPELVRRYLGHVVPANDNYFAALNSAVFSDGSFCYIPRGVSCPMELSTYFRINAANTGQFERTLIVADEGSQVSYLEGCTAPMRSENQLHAAIVEIIVEKDAEVRYSTVQNWYPGDKDGKGGVYNFVTKRGLCRGDNSKLSWTQVETGSAITWKYPSCVLKGDNSTGEFYSVAITTNRQQADTGSKMTHVGKNTHSRIISKGVSAGRSSNTYRGLVKVTRNATGARNFTQCDSLLLGDRCSAHTFPVIESCNRTATLEHEATTSKINEDQLFYCLQRGLSPEDAVALIVNGYAKDVLNKLPLEFAVEAQKLLELKLEGNVG
jgi:Fe-S cluster assembly protein SufB